eukprot:COSAG02_NODE_24056_length_699_cov_1.015000_1_plen_35_part_10
MRIVITYVHPTWPSLASRNPRGAAAVPAAVACLPL